MKKIYLVLLATVALDGAGAGLVMPILPKLLRHVGHSSEFGWQFGLFLSIYALMQFICAPLLGSLGDRYGRRPVLLATLAGVTVDYLFMAVAPSYWMLLVGRAIAGIGGASISVASAYVADITPEDQRAQRFGQLSAAMGAGFIAGPVIGGVLGDIWVRAPFLAAAALGALNLLMAVLVLRESPRAPTDSAADAVARTTAVDTDANAATAEPATLNPFAPLRALLRFATLRGMLACYAVLALVGQIGGTIWVLYGEDKFSWDSTTMGLSLAGFGVFHVLAQGLLVGPLTARLGERATLLVGIVADSTAYILIALATSGWMAFALMPLFCVGGIGVPALQALLSARVGADKQGSLQGVLASVASLASIGGPLLISPLYFMSRHTMPGLVWLVGAACYLLCLPLYLERPRAARLAE